MQFAAENQGPVVSGPVLVVLLLAGTSVFGLGYLWAVMKRANKDYKATKSAVKGLRKGFWSSWQAAMKAAMWIFVVFLLLVAWVVHDVRAEGSPKPSPSTSTHPVPAKVTSSRPAHRR